MYYKRTGTCQILWCRCCDDNIFIDGVKESVKKYFIYCLLPKFDALVSKLFENFILRDF